MISNFSRRLPTVAAILVLAVTLLATMASAGTIDKATPQMQVGNTGEVWIPAVQIDQATPEAVVDLTPRMLVGNTGETLKYDYSSWNLRDHSGGKIHDAVKDKAHEIIESALIELRLSESSTLLVAAIVIRQV